VPKESLCKIDLPYGTKAKYVKVKGNGNINNRENKITEVILIMGGE